MFTLVIDDIRWSGIQIAQIAIIGTQISMAILSVVLIIGICKVIDDKLIELLWKLTDMQIEIVNYVCKFLILTLYLNINCRKIQIC
jgi:hypothetical protein